MTRKQPPKKYRDDLPQPLRRAGQRPDELMPGQSSEGSGSGSHAAGTPGGGGASGGLAGTNAGDGSPDDVDLEDALGSGLQDQSDDAPGDDELQSGRTERAGGGTQANNGTKSRENL